MKTTLSLLRGTVFAALLLRRVMAALLVLAIAAPALGQGWMEYTSKADLFRVNFPGEPTLKEIRYTSAFDATYPGRVYSYESGASRYSATVVDFRDAERIHTERMKNCPPGAQSLCLGSEADGAQGVGSWKYDLHAAVDFATWQLTTREARLTYIAWAAIDRIGGRQLHFTNPDRSRTFAAIHMHENRLYVFEATVPAGAPEPGLFQQSPRFLLEDGTVARYDTIYTNGYPPPPRAR